MSVCKAAKVFEGIVHAKQLIELFGQQQVNKQVHQWTRI
jgi:hypothetical protein